MSKEDFNPYNHPLCIEDFLEAYQDEFYEFADRWFEEQLEANEERETVEDR